MSLPRHHGLTEAHILRTNRHVRAWARRMRIHIRQRTGDGEWVIPLGRRRRWKPFPEGNEAWYAGSGVWAVSVVSHRPKSIGERLLRAGALRVPVRNGELEARCSEQGLLETLDRVAGCCRAFRLRRLEPGSPAGRPRKPWKPSIAAHYDAAGG